MLSKKLISLGLVASQLAFAAPGFCSTGTSTLTAATTPEAALLTHVIALRGQGLSEQAFEEQTTEAFQQYNATASPVDREARLQAAMVSMNLYTASQAAQVMATADAAAARLSSMSSPSLSDARSASQAELSQLLQAMPEGAEFSGCARDVSIMYVAGLGAFLVGVFGIIAQGDSVPVSNWASVATLSGLGLAIVGVAIADSGC